MRLEIEYREINSGSYHINYCGGDQPDTLHVLGRKERPRFQFYGPILIRSSIGSPGLCPDSGILVLKRFFNNGFGISFFSVPICINLTV